MPPPIGIGNRWCFGRGVSHEGEWSGKKWGGLWGGEGWGMKVSVHRNNSNSGHHGVRRRFNDRHVVRTRIGNVSPAAIRTHGKARWIGANYQGGDDGVVGSLNNGHFVVIETGAVHPATIRADGHARRNLRPARWPLRRGRRGERRIPCSRRSWRRTRTAPA